MVRPLARQRSKFLVAIRHRWVLKVDKPRRRAGRPRRRLQTPYPRRNFTLRYIWVNRWGVEYESKDLGRTVVGSSGGRGQRTAWWFLARL